MAKPPLSMKPTGWFQVAWSDEISVGDVHRMKYFDRELIAWRAQSGQLTVMDAYCEHLGAHLGYGGHVEGEVIAVPVPRLAVEPRGSQRLHPVRGSAQPRPPHPHLPGGRAQRVGLHLARRRRPRTATSTRPTCSPSFADGSSAADYYPQQRLYRAEPWNCIRSTCSKTVSTSRISSSCTRRRSFRCSPATTSTSRCPTSTSPSPSKATRTRRSTTSSSGVEAINGGLGIAVTKSWGMVDNRTISAITPVDESHLRRPLHGLHRPDAGRRLAEGRGQGARVRRRRSSGSSRQDVHIWQHQRYSDPPALAGAEYEGLHRHSQVGQRSSIPTVSAAVPPNC